MVIDLAFLLIEQFIGALKEDVQFKLTTYKVCIRSTK